MRSRRNRRSRSRSSRGRRGQLRTRTSLPSGAAAKRSAAVDSEHLASDERPAVAGEKIDHPAGRSRRTV